MRNRLNQREAILTLTDGTLEKRRKAFGRDSRSRQILFEPGKRTLPEA